jgi:predicted DNA-binding transcriptional regulator AlpA
LLQGQGRLLSGPDKPDSKVVFYPERQSRQHFNSQPIKGPINMSRNKENSDVVSQQVPARSAFDELPNGAYLRQLQLVRGTRNAASLAPLPFSSATLWRKVKDGSFPKPVKLSQRVTAWRVGDVRAWLEKQQSE